MRWLALAFLSLAAHAQTPGPPGLFIVGPNVSPLPNPNSAIAASLTAANNTACVGSNGLGGIQPFYWEVGYANGPLASGSVNTHAQTPVLAATPFVIASASKWIYATWVLQQRGSVGALTANDIASLNQTDGYTNGSDTCATSTISACLALVQPANNPHTGCGAGQIQGWQNNVCITPPGDVGFFTYDGAHFQHGAIAYMGLSGLSGTVAALNANLQTISPGTPMFYTQPQVAGGLDSTATGYTDVLRRIIGNQLVMHDGLGLDQVCTNPSLSCNAIYSPLSPNAFNYSLGHWVETDGAFSSAGAFGFYPWIDATKTYYGVVSRKGNPGQGGASLACGAQIRTAFATGTQQ